MTLSDRRFFMRKKTLFLFAFSVLSGFAHAQKQKVSFKDSLDHKLDLSDWVLTAHGFIPFPFIITEPALGGFGGALFGVFVDPNTPYRDSVDGKEVLTRVKPNIYGAGGAMTVNGTWMLGAAAVGVIKKWRSNYLWPLAMLMSTWNSIGRFSSLARGDLNSISKPSPLRAN